MLRIAVSVCAAVLVGLTLNSAASAQATPPPSARISPVTDIYHGEKTVDPYRWMEPADAEFSAWGRAQDRIARAELSALPGYRNLYEQTAKSIDSDARISRVMRQGDLIYYRRRDPGKAQACLFVRAITGGPERLLIDPSALAGPASTLGVAVPSPNGHYLAYTLSDGGSEESTLFILDLKTGQRRPEVFDRTRFAEPTWSPDSRSLFFNRLQPGGAGRTRFDDQQIYRHRLGDDPARDIAVFKANVPGSKLGKGAFVGMIIPNGSPYAIALANSGVSAASELWVSSAQSLQGTPHWRKIAGLEDQIESFDFSRDGSHAWFVTFRGAPHRKVVLVDLRASAPLSKAKTIVPEGKAVLKSIAAAKDGLFVSYAAGPTTSLFKISQEGKRAALKIPLGSRVRDLAADNNETGAIASVEGWTLPRSAYSVTDSGLSDLKLSPAFPLDLSQLTVISLMATAKDGTQVPVDLIRRKDLPPGAPGTTLVEAYGAYGESMDPFFDASMIPFFLHGATYAVAHVRGGGELGEAWHLGGQKATKPNTWRDFIAVVEALERAGYATKGRVGGLGVSAGGIMIGRTVTERPDLLSAALMWAPMVNMLRFETTEGGPGNTAEFGSVATKEGYAALREMDAYAHVVDGTSYPAVLLTGGANDHRVPVWMAGKMAARLQAASSSGKPIRLRIDFEGGHHTMGVSKADEVSQSVDSWAFVLQHTGDPDFQPKASTGQ